MFAEIGLPVEVIGVTMPAEGRVAREVARQYLRTISEYWRGDQRAPFDVWLADYWTLHLPPRPRRFADAFSPHGGSGRGIHWYETPFALVGYVPGCTGGYYVPLPAAINQLSVADSSPPCAPCSQVWP